MNLRFGLREADIARRETGIVSWLGFRDHMAGKELAGLFGEWTTGPYEQRSGMLTQLALDSLVKRQLVQPTVVKFPGGLAFQAFELVNQSIASDIDPATVELAPRETVLLGFMDIRRAEPQAATELDERLGLRTEPDSWRTEACLGHLAKLGLLHAVENPPGAYKLA